MCTWRVSYRRSSAVDCRRDELNSRLCCSCAAASRVSCLSCQIEATDKTASIKISFSQGAAAQDLSRKLRGVTVKIKGVKLHAFVRVR